MYDRPEIPWAKLGRDQGSSDQPGIASRGAITGWLSLVDHSAFLANNVTFLLDASLGLINIEQNGIIKFFSVAAVILMPPTLVASIYGMNFHNMPELGFRYGYPMALSLMAISAAACWRRSSPHRGR